MWNMSRDSNWVQLTRAIRYSKNMTDKYTFPASKEQEMLVLNNAGHGKSIHRKLAEAADKARKTFRQPEKSSDTMSVQVEGDKRLSARLTGLTVVHVQVRHGIGIVLMKAEQGGNTVYPVERIEAVRQAVPGTFTDDDALAILLEEDPADSRPRTPDVVSGETVLGGDALGSPRDTEANVPPKRPKKSPPGKLPARPKEGEDPSTAADGVLKRWFNRG